MAGVESLREEFLTCTICTEMYADPITLTCGHSFCRVCVTKFIKTRPEAIESEVIPCAYCRQETQVPSPTKPVEEWAEQLQPSLILRRLMDKLQCGPEIEEGQAICFLCIEVEETTPASFWCSDCEVSLCSRCAKMHLKAPSSKKHEVFELSEEAKLKQSRKLKCEEHEEELIKFICKNCNKMACQTCCIIHHRTCQDVVTLESMITDIKAALQERKLSLKTALAETKATMKKEVCEIGEVKKNTEIFRSGIKSSVTSAISLLRQRETELLNEVDNVSAKQVAERQANVKSCKITIQMYQQHCEFIDQALQTESEVDMYDMYQVCLSGAVESVEVPETDTKNTPIVGEVKLSLNTEPLEKAILQMGKLHVTYLRCHKHGPGSSLKPVLHDTTDIKHREDSTSPGPIDVTVLTVNLTNIMVVADCNNKSLKSVFVKNSKKEIRVLKLSSTPLRLAKMRGNRVAATAENCHVVVAEARPELVLISDVRTKKDYHGITALSEDMLAVGSFTPPVIDILNLRGDVLKSFTPRNTGLDLIQNPHFLSTTPDDSILVSDCYSKSVYCLTPEGGIVFTYRPKGNRALEYPRGITVTNTGDVLLADWGSKKIVQLTLDGTFVRDILTSEDGIDVPWGLFVDDTRRLYVCQRAVSSKCVKVFSLTQEND